MDGPLCSREDVKAFLAVTGTEQDDMIASIVTGVSARIVEYLDRMGYTVHAQDLAEYHDGVPLRDLILDHYPVLEIRAVVQDGTTLSDGTDYELRSGRTLRRLGGATWWATDEVQVFLRAGNEDPAVPDDLVEACKLQSAWQYKQSTPGGARLGLASNAPAEGDGVSYLTDAWLPEVQSILDARRVVA